MGGGGTKYGGLLGKDKRFADFHTDVVRWLDISFFFLASVFFPLWEEILEEGINARVWLWLLPRLTKTYRDVDLTDIS